MVIRTMNVNEYPLLKDFLYEAIFIPNGHYRISKAIVEKPELQVYYTNFGTQKGDHALVVEEDETIIGAVWVRIMKDYGHIDESTPSLAISLYEQYRHKGIGTAMMEQMLEVLKTVGYQQVSLSVQKENYAWKMYHKLGFYTVKECGDEQCMVKAL